MRSDDYENLANLRSCLRSKEWLEVRGTRPGDLLGETLKDTFQRELEAIEERLEQ